MAKKKTGIARRTISIPSDLDAKMSKFVDVNWSSVAKMAFEAKLVSLSQAKVSKEMADVIARMREAQQAENSQMYKKGFKAGEKWANRDAKPRDLRRIEEFYLANVHNWDDVFENLEGSAYSSHEGLHATIMRYDSPDRDEAEEFFEDCGASREEMFEADYVRGFADGALDVWDEVKGHL